MDPPGGAARARPRERPRLELRAGGPRCESRGGAGHGSGDSGRTRSKEGASFSLRFPDTSWAPSPHLPFLSPVPAPSLHPVARLVYPAKQAWGHGSTSLVPGEVAWLLELELRVLS